MKNIPNILTVLRLLACPFLIYLFEISNHLWILIIFVLACLTDFFDGYLARKRDFKSNFGKVLDPFADKILIITMLISLLVFKDYSESNFIKIPFYIIIIREIIVSCLRFNIRDENKNIDVTIFSKYKTFIQMIPIGLIMVIYVLEEYANIIEPFISGDILLFIFSVTIFFIYLATFITVITGIQHFKTFLKLKK